MQPKTSHTVFPGCVNSEGRSSRGTLQELIPSQAVDLLQQSIKSCFLGTSSSSWPFYVPVLNCLAFSSSFNSSPEFPNKTSSFYSSFFFFFPNKRSLIDVFLKKIVQNSSETVTTCDGQALPFKPEFYTSLSRASYHLLC